MICKVVFIYDEYITSAYTISNPSKSSYILSWDISGLLHIPLEVLVPVLPLRKDDSTEVFSPGN